MIINGRFSQAKIFTINNPKNQIDSYAQAQIKFICDNESSSGTIIRVMPDVHPGQVGTIGLTINLNNSQKIMPMLTGIDIGCGLSITKISKVRKEWQKLDSVIKENVPSGFKLRRKIHPKSIEFDYECLKCYEHLRINKADLSLGTLGSGNHFIEVDIDNENNIYLVIHSGSRHLGKEVTEYYLNAGQKLLKQKNINIPYELTYLEGNLRENYIHDVRALTKYAELNRKIMILEIIKGMKWKNDEIYSCPHNYIDEYNILRKGAVSARENEFVIIPINMRDGIILAEGKGNEDWNYSAPHGAGRIMKREDVKNSYTLSQFKASMKNIYSPSINQSTLDEAPFAYRGLTEIQEAVNDTVNVTKIITPLYNFKAGD